MENLDMKIIIQKLSEMNDDYNKKEQELKKVKDELQKQKQQNQLMKLLWMFQKD